MGMRGVHGAMLRNPTCSLMITKPRKEEQLAVLTHDAKPTIVIAADKLRTVLY